MLAGEEEGGLQQTLGLGPWEPRGLSSQSKAAFSHSPSRWPSPSTAQHWDTTVGGRGNWGPFADPIRARVHPGCRLQSQQENAMGGEKPQHPDPKLLPSAQYCSLD